MKTPPKRCGSSIGLPLAPASAESGSGSTGSGSNWRGGSTPGDGPSRPSSGTPARRLGGVRGRGRWRRGGCPCDAPPKDVLGQAPAQVGGDRREFGSGHGGGSRGGRGRYLRVK